MNRIEVKNLYKIFGPKPERVYPLLEEGLDKTRILAETGCVVGINNASFNVAQRETFVIMGLSGSGKSTVIRCLNRLMEPTAGEILVDGEDIRQMDYHSLLETRRTKMSMVFQNFGLIPQRSVLRNTEYGLEICGKPAEERYEAAMQALKMVGLEGYEYSMPSELSGGMQQRVGLARALANNPEVLLMDEAFSALDPLIRTQMQDELLELQARLHKTIVFITHDLDEALKIGDRIAIMKDGAIVQIGTPEEILTKPADDYVRAFVQNVDRTKVITAQSIMRKVPTITVPQAGPRAAVRAMEKLGSSTIFAVDSDRHLQGILSIDDALELEKQGVQDVKSKLVYEDVYLTRAETPIADLLTTALTARHPLAVRDEEERLIGVLDRATIMAEVLENNNEQDTDAITPLAETADLSPKDSDEQQGAV